MEPERISINILRQLILYLGRDCIDKQTYFNRISRFFNEHPYIENCGAYNISLSLLHSYEVEKNVKMAILEFLSDYIEGFLSLLDLSGIKYFISIMDNNDDDYKIFGLRLVTMICKENERNREICISLGIFTKLARLIVTTQRNEHILFPAIKMLTTLNWELSGNLLYKYYDQIKQYLDLMLKPLCDLLRVENHPPLHSYLLEALVSIVLTYNYADQVIREGGFKGVLNVLDKITIIPPGLLSEDLFKDLASYSIALLALLSNNVTVIRGLMNCNFAPKIYHLLYKYKDDAEFATFSLLLIGNIALIHPVYGEKLFLLNFPPLIIHLLVKFPDDARLLKAGCWCIETMSHGNHEYHPMFLNNGGKEILTKISRMKQPCSAIAKRALRQLGITP